MSAARKNETVAWAEKIHSESHTIYYQYKCPYCGYYMSDSTTFQIAEDKHIHVAGDLYSECENENCCQEIKIIGFVDTEKEMLEYGSDTGSDEPKVEAQSILAYWNMIADMFENEIDSFASALQERNFDTSRLDISYLEALSKDQLINFYAELVYETCDIVFGGDIDAQTSFLLQDLQEKSEIVQILMDF